MAATVVTFGEIMLRLKSPGYERFFQSPALEATFGGGEANVAVSLANFGMDARYVSVLPKNDIGEACVRELRGFGKAEQAFFDTIAAEAAQGSVKWAEAAAGAGFSDQSHLCRVTRRITGYAPQALYDGIYGGEAFWVYRIWV